MPNSRRRRRGTSGPLDPGVNEVSFHARPHRSVYNTLEVVTGATDPRWRVDSMGHGRIGKGERREG